MQTYHGQIHLLLANGSTSEKALARQNGSVGELASLVKDLDS